MLHLRSIRKTCSEDVKVMESRHKVFAFSLAKHLENDVEEEISGSYDSTQQMWVGGSEVYACSKEYTRKRRCKTQPPYTCEYYCGYDGREA